MLSRVILPGQCGVAVRQSTVYPVCAFLDAAKRIEVIENRSQIPAIQAGANSIPIEVRTDGLEEVDQRQTIPARYSGRRDHTKLPGISQQLFLPLPDRVSRCAPAP